MQMKVSRVVSGLGICIAVVCSVASVALASDAECELDWIDCDGIHHVMPWTCPEGKNCCENVLKRKTGETTSCIVSATHFCKEDLTHCHTIHWEPIPR